MSIPDSSITPQILKAAEIEFLEKGFVNASLRDICQKAGVTTGALYKRFVGKDRLFYAVLKPTLDDINRFIKEVEGKDYKHLEENRTKLIWEMSEDTLKKSLILFMIDIVALSYCYVNRKVQNIQIFFMNLSQIKLKDRLLL